MRYDACVVGEEICRCGHSCEVFCFVLCYVKDDV